MKNRNPAADNLRTLALLAICIVNVPFFALPTAELFTPASSWPDQLGNFIVAGLLQLKFYLLFAFIFGWGSSHQLLNTAGQPEAKQRYFRRVGGLAVIGALHSILVFEGDILLLYACLALALWRVRSLNAAALCRVAIKMVLFSLLCLTLLALILEQLSGELSSTTSMPLVSAPAYLDQVQLRLLYWPFSWVFLLLLQGPLAFAAFLAGLAAAKTEFLKQNSVGMLRLRQHLLLLFLIAIPLNALYAATLNGLWRETAGGILALLGFVGTGLAAPALSAIYLYCVVSTQHLVRLPSLLLMAGQNSLSSYVLQGIMAGWVFGSYGLGLFAKFDQLQLIPLALIIAVCAMLLVSLYAHFFGKGPLEQLMQRISQ